MLPTAIFLIVIMGALAAFIAQLTAAANAQAGQDMQGARALQAARAGVEAGLYSVRTTGSCPGGTLPNLPGLTGFKVSWVCAAYSFNEGGRAKGIWQIESTACVTAGKSCPSTDVAEQQSTDYIERQIVVVAEQQ